MEQTRIDMPMAQRRDVVLCEDCRHGMPARNSVLCTKGGAHLKRRGFFCADGKLRKGRGE